MADVMQEEDASCGSFEPPKWLTVDQDGGVASPCGFKAAGIHAGFRADPERRDLALVVAAEPSPCAAVFTQNVFCAAPVQRNRAILDEGHPGQSWGTARAVVINSGVANAATGARGRTQADRSAEIAAEAIGCPVDEVLVASTGVIGVDLPLEPFEQGMPLAVEAASAAGSLDAALAIMTTDTHPKHCAVSFTLSDEPDACRYTLGAMTKGSGMIMPSMATMIAVITTDVPLNGQELHQDLLDAVRQSFNCITVDSDTSTNDSCFLLASGAADPTDFLANPSQARQRFQQALQWLCIHLARAMAADGEGATKLITVRVQGAQTPEEADCAARTVANSPLVKTAVFGHDLNWGRVAAALGRSGATFNQDEVSIRMLGLLVCQNGLNVSFDEEEALRRFEAPEISIEVDLGAGEASATMWTCDFSHDYVTINGDYRS